MKLNEPIGNPIYAPPFIRAALGAFLLYTGRSQLSAPTLLVDQVQALKILPEHLATVFALLLPYLEILAGGLIFVGYWTTLGGIIAAVIVLPFVYTAGAVTGKGIFNKELFVLMSALSLLYSGAGAISVDRFRKGGGG